MNKRLIESDKPGERVQEKRNQSHSFEPQESTFRTGHRDIRTPTGIKGKRESRGESRGGKWIRTFLQGANQHYHES